MLMHSFNCALYSNSAQKVLNRCSISKIYQSQSKDLNPKAKTILVRILAPNARHLFSQSFDFKILNETYWTYWLQSFPHALG